ncbi:MAG: RipA family octameric membrane protein [Rhodanobacteraceae bacterium]
MWARAILRHLRRQWAELGVRARGNLRDQEAYEREFGLPATNAKGDPNKVRAALDHALGIRKFEIELYWQRAAYFWALIAAAFAHVTGPKAISVSKINQLANLFTLILWCGLLSYSVIETRPTWLTIGERFCSGSSLQPFYAPFTVMR